jgi:hypothetical protein
MEARALAARTTATLFDGFMKQRRFALDVERNGVPDTITVDSISGPGHNVTAVAGVMLEPDGRPLLALRRGDSCIHRPWRGMPYWSLGFIAGRWDKVGADPARIGIEEVAEEAGGKPLPGAFWALGTKLVPTMPHESTEADAYFVSVIHLDEKVTGDGGGMEVPARMGAAVLPIEQAFGAMDSGGVSAGGRVRTMFNRALDKLGYIPQLGTYIFDQPALRERFSTLGLGEAHDVRPLQGATPAPQPQAGNAAGLSSPPPDPQAERIDGAEILSRRDIPVSDEATFVDAKVAHAIHENGTARLYDKPFPLQLLLVNYDRAKVVRYYVDAERGPLVHMAPVERPVLAVKGLALDGERTYKDENVSLLRDDVDELKLDRRRSADEQVAAAFHGTAEKLASPTAASTNTSDLFYHFYAVQTNNAAEARDFVPLSDAIEKCRSGQGDAQTEAALELLAERTHWIPGLRMTVEQARQLAGGSAA